MKDWLLGRRDALADAMVAQVLVAGAGVGLFAKGYQIIRSDWALPGLQWGDLIAGITLFLLAFLPVYLLTGRKAVRQRRQELLRRMIEAVSGYDLVAGPENLASAFRFFRTTLNDANDPQEFWRAQLDAWTGFEQFQSLHRAASADLAGNAFIDDARLLLHWSRLQGAISELGNLTRLYRIFFSLEGPGIDLEEGRRNWQVHENTVDSIMARVGPVNDLTAVELRLPVF